MRETLGDWERYLEPLVEQARLLGEIPLSSIEVDRIGLLIRDLLKRRGMARGTDYLVERWPRTFVTFLALTAAYNTESNFWGVVQQTLGMREQGLFFTERHHWGKLFQKITGALKLPRFEAVGSGANPYVTVIRLHGGIPAYSLGDFFERILDPWLDNPRYRDLPVKELVEVMLGRSTIQMFVDSPVRNYLEHGGGHALAFLENCRRMALAYRRDPDELKPETFDLRPYVVRAYREYKENQASVQTSLRLRRPGLRLEPHQHDVYLELPAQPVEGDTVTQFAYYWEVEAYKGGRSLGLETYPTRPRRQGYDLLTKEISHPLAMDAHRLEVRFCRRLAQNDLNGTPGGVCLKAWRLHLLPTQDQPMLLAFSSPGGELLHWTQALPPGEVWLIYPVGSELQAPGGKLQADYGNFYGVLYGWRGQAWDLSRAESVRLLASGSATLQALVPVLGPPAEPRLSEQGRLACDRDPDGVPVYIGAPPELRLPLRPGREPRQEAARWRISLASAWAAQPALPGKEQPLDELWAHCRVEEETLALPLAPVLGERPCGTYILKTAAQHAGSFELRFRVWPELEISGLMPYYLPGVKGAQEVGFSMRVPEGCQVLPQAGVEELWVQKIGASYQVSLGTEHAVAELHLVKPLPSGEPVRLPLALAAPRLRWALALGDGQRQLEWQTLPIKLPVDAFLQASSRSLFVELPLAQTPPLEFELELVDAASGRSLQVASQAVQLPRGQTRWRFPLDAFSDTLRRLPEGVAAPEFRLQVENIETQEMQTVSLLRLTRTIRLEYLWLQILDPPNFCLEWRETHRLRNRRVRIWSAWQPWAEPVEERIPDDADGEHAFTASLPPSWYRIQFLVAAPWDESGPPEQPPEDAELVETVTPQDRLRWIEGQLQQNPGNRRQFMLRFERACIYDSLGWNEQRDAEIQACYNNLDSATPAVLIGFHRWLEPRDPHTQRAVRIKMFRAEKLGELFTAYPSKSLIRQRYLEVFTQLSPKMVPPPSAHRVLENEQEPLLRLHALRVLAERRQPGFAALIVNEVAEGKLAEKDAERLLQGPGQESAQAALEQMAGLPPSPVVERLVRRLVECCPQQQLFVYKGFWVRTDAGWGVVDSIVGEDGAQLEYFRREVDKPLLRITLRPQAMPETILVDLKNNQLEFPGASDTFQCRKEGCGGFLSTEQSRVTGQHTRAAHMGIGAAFSRAPARLYLSFAPEYSLKAPADPFA